MEDGTKLPIFQQPSVCEISTLQREIKKRMTMKKRLTTKRSLQDYFRDITDQNQSMTNLNNQSSECIKSKKIIELRELASLNEATLNKKYDSDPFLKRGLKLLVKKNEKQNNIIKSSLNQISQEFQDQNNLNLRMLKKITKTRQVEMLQKVVNTLGKEKLLI